MYEKNGKIGDEFMRQIEPAAAYVPYTTSVGNHEEAYNFSHYTERFTMPGSDHGLFYSFDLGATHFIALSTEFYYFLKYGTDQLKTQYNWLLEDLKVGFERMENLFQDKKYNFLESKQKPRTGSVDHCFCPPFNVLYKHVWRRMQETA